MCGQMKPAVASLRAGRNEEGLTQNVSMQSRSSSVHINDLRVGKGEGSLMMLSGTNARQSILQPFTTVKPRRKALVTVASAPAAQSDSSSHRRHVLLAGLITGLAGSELYSPAAHAEQACSNLTKASNGIEWCDTKEGSGKEPSKGQLIRCHYTGRLDSNGKVFDSSYGRRPLTFKVGAREVIQGWDKTILGEDDLPAMKEGGKRRVKIPPSLAYGERGAGKVIPPNSTLIFDVELLGKK